MALYGLVPVPEIQFADFIFPAFDQIVNELAKYRYRSGGEYPAKMVIRTPVGGGIRGGHYHSQSPESLFIHVAGLKVVCPSNPYDAKGLLLGVDPRSRSGALLRAEAHLPRGQGRGARGRLHGPARQGERRARRARTSRSSPGARCSTRRSTPPTKAAEQGVEAEVIDLRTLWPVDIDTIVESVKKTGRLVVVHEAPRTCGFGAELVRLVDGARLLPPRGAARARHRLRHAVPVHARDRVPAARAPHPAGAA